MKLVRLTSLISLVFILGCGERGYSPVVPAGEGATEPFFEGEKKVPVKPYKIPQFIERRIEEEAKEGGGETSRFHKESYELSKAAQKYILEGLDFTVDLDRKKMRFKGSLKSASGNFSEEVLLEGDFDPSQSVWTSDNLFPIDAQTRKEKRMQATAVCLDINVCDRVAVRFYVKIEDELLSLHFEKDAVSFGEAQSGHEEDESFEDLEDLLKYPPKKAEPKKEDPPVTQEPPPPPVVEKEQEEEDEPVVVAQEEVEEEEDYNEENFKGVAVEYNGPTITPNPRVEKDSIDGIEKYLTPRTSDRAQAIGRHNNGRLESGKALPLDGPGFTRRDRKSSHPAYGTDLLVSLIQKASSVTEAAHPGRPPISVGHLSAKTGRKLKGHASHQTGLDVDVAFPLKSSNSRSFWVAVNEDGSLSSKMDQERFWKFTKSLVCTKSGKSSHVMVMFVDQRIKRQMCQYAKKIGEDLSNKSSCGYQALRSMKHWKGHHHHLHLRLYCPGTTGCSNANVSLPSSTGC